MPQEISILIEWENSLLAEMERPLEMLRRLRKQVEQVHSEHQTKFELVLTFNEDDVDEDLTRQIVFDVIDQTEWPGSIKFQRTSSQHYYELKNSAAEIAQGDIIIFLDSDVVPEEGWLSSILSSMDEPDAQFVAGNTYMSTDDFVSRCFAVFWTFKPRQSLPDKHARPSFFANNIAFRKSFFLRHKFPIEGSYRGQCGALADSIKEEGLEIIHNGRAWVSHPPPNGLSHFATRAIAKGHDNVYWSRKRRLGSLQASPFGAAARYIANLATTLARVVTRPAKIPVGPINAACGAVIGAAYHSIVFCSEIVAFFNPGFIRRNIQI